MWCIQQQQQLPAHQSRWGGEGGSSAALLTGILAAATLLSSSRAARAVAAAGSDATADPTVGLLGAVAGLYPAITLDTPAAGALDVPETVNVCGNVRDVTHAAVLAPT